MSIYGLIGRHLSHSWSVPIHRAMGCADYRLTELEPEELAPFLAGDEIRGLNVTIPYKRDVIKSCDELAESAARVGSVNTIVKGADGRLVGHNTDLFGLQYNAERAGITFSDRKVLIFGSGGASLAAHAAAELGGASEIIVISRSGQNNYDNLSRHADADILINATPVGMYPKNGESPADISAFPKCCGVIDLIYNPQRTALLMQAEKAGIPHTDGLPMLVAQAAEAERLFTGGEDSGGIIKMIEPIVSKLRRDMTNIVLIAMPGGGKSVVGDELAKLTGRRLIDIDAEIVKADGRSIDNIFKESGEAEFRRLEREQTTAAGRESGCIIVTGGGVVKDDRNYAPLHQNGRIYHIERDVSLLARDGRPLSLNADLDAMYRERLPMYERFRDAVVINDASPLDAAERIRRDFNESACN